jgi:hypothetical protein
VKSHRRPAKSKRRCHCATIRGSHGFGESEPRCPQQKKQLSGPEQNVQQTPSLQIVQVFALEAQVESLAGTLFSESTHRGQVDGLGAEFAAPGIQTLELFVVAQQCDFLRGSRQLHFEIEAKTIALRLKAGSYKQLRVQVLMRDDWLRHNACPLSR